MSLTDALDAALAPKPILCVDSLPLSDEDRAKLETAFRSLSARVIWDLLRSNGYDIPRGAVERHKGGRCSCARG